jgi:hypothetical protein
MAKRRNEQTNQLSHDLSNVVDGATSSLVRLIRSEKSKGNRLLYTNGDLYVGVIEPYYSLGIVTERSQGLLLPNAPLVLGDVMRDVQTDRLYVGDKKWFIGAMSLAMAISADKGSNLSIVGREDAVGLIAETEQMVQPLTVFPGDLSLS